jgi:integrase
MATVFRRKWKNSKGQQSCWALGYNDTFGNRKIESGFGTKVEAEKELSKRLQEIENGSYFEVNKTLTFKQITDKFLKYHVEMHLKESTCDTYMGFLRVHILPVLGNMKIIEITPNTIYEYIRLKQKETKLSNCSINKHIVLIKSILNHAVDNGLIIKNLAGKVKKLNEKNTEQSCLTQKEVFAVLETAKKHYPDFYPLLFTAVFTGMRRGEILALTWDRINFVERYIKIDRSVYNKKFNTPKTLTSNRKINMPDELIKTLKEWRLRCPHGELNLVFPNQRGVFMDAHNLVNRKFKPTLRRAGVTEIRFHDLRHTFASILLTEDANPKYVQNQMGHASIKITMDTYSHLMPEAHQKGVDTLNRIL